MIAFTADNHIGITTQWGIKERGFDFMTAFHNVVDSLVKSEDSNKALIIGGDLFDTPFPPSFAVEFVQREIKKLVAAGGSAFGIDGNHDIADCKWFKVCGITPLSEDPVVVNGVSVCGINFVRSLDVISKINEMADIGVKCDIIVLHLALGELNRMGAASDISAKEIMPALKTMGVKLVLLGHIHIRQETIVDGIRFAYCGSTELCSMNEPKEKSFDVVDPTTFSLTAHPISTRSVEHTVISTEEEFAKYAAGITTKSEVLQSVFVTHDVTDGVKRLRTLAKEHGLLMRIQVMKPQVIELESAVDRSAGVIGLEQAIVSFFDPTSIEASLIRSILRSPDTWKMTVEKFMTTENTEVQNDTEETVTP